ncbi:MAG TPA: hypothetical protein VGO45_09285 [Bacteroidia bacterium]|nr:hypothetical protein [Bacteroidia bacterium]
MKKLRYLSLLLTGLLCSFSTLAAGPRKYHPTHHAVNRAPGDTVPVAADSSDYFKIKNRKFEFGMRYASNNTFMGRRDSVNHIVLSPSFSYTGIHGFNASIMASHIDLSGPSPAKTQTATKPARIPILDEYDATIGWDHDWTDNFSTSILETHSYFDVKSPRIRSTIDNDFNLGASYDFKYVMADASGDFCHGPKTKYGQAKDNFFTVSLSHDFDIDPLFHTKGELEIEPRLSVVYGTQNFFLVYTKAKPGDSTLIKKAEYEKKLAKFGLLNYMFSLPLTYTRGKWAFTAEWDYNMPQSVPAGSSSTPYSVFVMDLTFTLKGKDQKIRKKVQTASKTAGPVTK